MRKDINTTDFSQHLFWDIDLDGFDLHAHKSHLIQKVLEYGELKDWELLQELYGLETIKEISLNLRSLDVMTLSYLSTIFNIDKTEFRCYKNKQLHPNLWNS